MGGGCAGCALPPAGRRRSPIGSLPRGGGRRRPIPSRGRVRRAADRWVSRSAPASVRELAARPGPREHVASVPGRHFPTAGGSCPLGAQRRKRNRARELGPVRRQAQCPVRAPVGCLARPRAGAHAEATARAARQGFDALPGPGYPLARGEGWTAAPGVGRAPAPDEEPIRAAAEERERAPARVEPGRAPAPGGMVPERERERASRAGAPAGSAEAGSRAGLGKHAEYRPPARRSGDGAARSSARRSFPPHQGDRRPRPVPRHGRRSRTGGGRRCRSRRWSERSRSGRRTPPCRRSGPSRPRRPPPYRRRPRRCRCHGAERGRRDHRRCDTA